MRTNLFLSLFSSFLLTCAFYPIQFSLLACVALVPFFYLLERTSARGAVLWGYLTGLLVSSVMVQWSSLATVRDNVIFIFVSPLYLAVYALTHHSLLKRSRWVVTLLVPLLWGAKEILQFFTNLGLWMTSLGWTQSSLLTIFSKHFFLAGPVLAVWVVFLNMLFLSLCKSFVQRKNVLVPTVAFVVVLAVPWGWQWLHGGWGNRAGQHFGLHRLSVDQPPVIESFYNMAQPVLASHYH